MPKPSSDGQLKGRVILITGAARGIGASVAKACAEKGATTILLDKRLNLLESVYDDIEANSQTEPTLYPLDLKGASLADYQQLAEQIDQHYGKLDTLIHCAAELGQLAPVEHQDPKLWLETLHINLTASFMLTQACIPLLKKSTNSQLLFTSDSRQAKAYWGAYGISKAGIEALAAQLAEEFEAEAKIQVHVVTPPDTHTELFVKAFPAVNPTKLPTADEAAKSYLSLIT